ncbi:MAG: type II toxin-antitoxin system PemK/MazF family toxin, partial [Chloroflexota bacterium]|nr:type II toxin-antitoxin system PemK/MazF family toxin [Chloroflexota bacterium]
MLTILRTRTLYNPGDVVILDFPGVQGTKRRPAVVLSSDTYHATRPDLIVGLITSQTTVANNPSDY